MGDDVGLEDGLDFDVDAALLADLAAGRLAERFPGFAFSAGVRPRRLAGVTDEENGIAAGDPDARTAGSPVLEPLEQGLVLGGGEFPRQFPDSKLAVSRGVLDEDLVAPSPDWRVSSSMLSPVRPRRYVLRTGVEAGGSARVGSRPSLRFALLHSHFGYAFVRPP